MTFPTQDTPPRLELRGLTRAFDGRTVVDGVDLSVGAGEVTCLLGPSGCGKSTTLRILAGVERQDSGEVLVDGEVICDATRQTPPEARGIGLMFQDFALFPHLTVGGNVAYGLPKGVDRDCEVHELLARVGMDRFVDRYPHELSGGEQQRVALARALGPRPRIMLMDEPFSGLDDRLRDEIRDQTLDVLKDSGVAVLLVTHDPAEAMRMADQIALMRAGRIVQTGTPYHVYHRPADLAAAAFFSDVNHLSATVEGALAQTPYGAFLCPGQPDGTVVDIAIRPNHVKVEFDRNGKGPAPTIEFGTAQPGVVERARFMGAESLVEFRMEDGSRMTATLPSVFLPPPGTRLWLMIRRDRAMIFPRSQSSQSQAA